MSVIINFFLKALALVGFILISPLLVVCSILVLCEDGFPIIFHQKRFGKNMKIFKIKKLRTMKKETPNLGTHENDETNILKIGKLIRKFKLDEFPQLLNYLEGSINLVGPRPGLINQAELAKNRDSRGVFSVKPGITGLSQVLGFNMSDPELLSIVDSIYIKNTSMKLDIIIFFATFFKPLRKKLDKMVIQEIQIQQELHDV
tara:strand:- start:1832 stop:2437 length:606 start_codon:yes stop_codon:yes gene_type:complete